MRSDEIKKGFERAPHRSLLWATGQIESESDFDRPFIGIANSYIDLIISDEEYQREKKTITHCPPLLKESYFYRKIFEQFFGKNEQLIPHFWMPRWVKTQDPSARELTGYQE